MAEIKESTSEMCAELIMKVALKSGDERAAKCGYDLFRGLAAGDLVPRYNAWADWFSAIVLPRSCQKLFGKTISELSKAAVRSSRVIRGHSLI